MSSSPPHAATRSHRAFWIGAFTVVAALLVARNLIALDGVPFGSYVDETSIGYNAWAISTSGVDEHGAHLPLYFTAFGEYKNPVYIYSLSALLRVLPLTVTTERLPAALFGLITCFCITLLAWRRSRSLPITLLVLVLAALTPWLTIESRVGFEVISMMAAVSAALLCLSIAVERESPRWYLVTGVCLAIAVYAYSTGRVAISLFALVLALARYRSGGRGRRWMLVLLPIVASYALLLAWNFAHPGALTARFDLISVGADGAPLGTVALRFVDNYAKYFGADFLFISGDSNLRHATQFGGMLPAVMLPLMVAGVWAAWCHRHDPYVRTVLLFVVVAPVSAALTNEGVPHSLRASVMLPPLTALAIEGAAEVRRRLRAWQVLYVLSGMALVLQGMLFTIDMYTAWPARSAAWFDKGEIDAITRAVAISAGRPVLLSQSLDPPYISAAFVLRPAPPAQFTEDSMTSLLAEMHMVSVDPGRAIIAPGAVAVLSAADQAPPGSTILFEETLPPPEQGADIIVYRLP
jgi:4-amino-4-deoxy-L-arabinose transferase-like glycosyltransferase